MEKYQNTVLWKKTLAKRVENDEWDKDREILRVEYEKFRNNAKLLAQEIALILPEYTVHDITHADALWEMADLILPSDYDISPVEAFVLGGAFLLHDLGMAVAAYPGGLDEIKKEKIWIDTAVALSKEKKLTYDIDDIESFDQAIGKIATEKTLRMLHAQKAKELANISWKDGNGKDIFLIDNFNLRNSFGTVIGSIAESHWWYIEELDVKLPPIMGALAGFSDKWTVDPLKLACILRVVDAMHIDDRRSPFFLKTIRKPEEISELHWIFQEKLFQPLIVNNRLSYTSKSPFSITEVNAWWLCYDTITMINEELHKVDTLLLSNHRNGFNVIGVNGIDNLKSIAKLITTIGWEPVDTKVKVNNVARLVNTIGGAQLYGKNSLVPLRELIQNASDAIRARRIWDDEDENYGEISIEIAEDESGSYIKVTDNGIGMSQKVLTGVLLDFGQSFWGTEGMHEEFPGLESKSFKSTGHFGIGFFSIFMWSKRIKLISNRFDAARENTKILEFFDGVNSRPILRQADESEYIKNGGTSVKIWLTDNMKELILHNHFSKVSNFEEIISRMCFALDCDLYFLRNGVKKNIIKANDWKRISTLKFLQRLCGKKIISEFRKNNVEDFEIISKNLELIKDENGQIVGRASLYKGVYGKRNGAVEGIVTVGGFATSNLTGIIGVMIGETDRASRDVAIPIASQKDIELWVLNQTTMLTNCNDNLQLEISWFAYTLSSLKTKIKLAKWKNEIVNYDEIVEIVKRQSIKEYILVHDAAVSIYERDNKETINLADNVFVCSMGMPGILQTHNTYSIVEWPNVINYLNNKGINIIERQIISAISTACGNSINELEKLSSFSSDEEDYNAVIGKGKVDIIMDNVDIIRLSN